ncbi:hypothetical protein BsWGS_12039 [Bradybaena similaris]
MPPIGQSVIDFSNISDTDLSQMLKDYGLTVGPINVATRKTYERKLVQLKTGVLPPPSQQPVDSDDDDDDQEVQIRRSDPPRRPVQDSSESAHSYVSSGRGSDFSPSKFPSRESDFSASRYSSRESDFSASKFATKDSGFSASTSYGYSPRNTEFSPEVRSRPPLPVNRETPSSSSYATPPVRRPVPTKVSKEQANGIPLWLKLLAATIVVVLIYLIYINMEPAAISNIPEVQNKVEV